MVGDGRLVPASLDDTITTSYSVLGVSPVSWKVVSFVVSCKTCHRRVVMPILLHILFSICQRTTDSN